MTKLIAAFRDIANANKQESVRTKQNLFFTSDAAPNAGRGFLILEVSKSHAAMHHFWWDFSGRVISSSQSPLPDNTQHS